MAAEAAETQLAEAAETQAAEEEVVIEGFEEQEDAADVQEGVEADHTDDAVEAAATPPRRAAERLQVAMILEYFNVHGMAELARHLASQYGGGVDDGGGAPSAAGAASTAADAAVATPASTYHFPGYEETLRRTYAVQGLHRPDDSPLLSRVLAASSVVEPRRRRLPRSLTTSRATSSGGASTAAAAGGSQRRQPEEEEEGAWRRVSWVQFQPSAAAAAAATSTFPSAPPTAAPAAPSAAERALSEAVGFRPVFGGAYEGDAYEDDVGA